MAKSRFSLNVLANFAGRGIGFAALLIATPLYVRLLGVEGFGLIGVFYAGRALLSVLDAGLTPTVAREVARRGADPAGGLPDLFSTMELGFVVAALGLAGVGLLAAPWLAGALFPDSSFGPGPLRDSLRLIAVSLAAVWVSGFYQSVLIGRERQSILNAVQSVSLLATHAVGLLVVFRTGSPVGLFLALSTGGLAGALALRTVALRDPELPLRGGRAHRGALGEVPTFIKGMSLVTITGAGLMAIDRVWAGAALSLEPFGEYTLARQVVDVIPAVVFSAVFTALLPRLTAQLATSAQGDLVRDYRRATELFSLLGGLASAALVWFGVDLLALWLGDARLALRLQPVVALFAAGTFLNGLMNAAYALQLARGDTELPLRLNLGLLVVHATALAILLPRLGPTGAGAAWLGVMALYFAAGYPLTSRRHLPQEPIRWRAALAPGLAAHLVFAAACRLTAGDGPASPAALAALGLALPLGLLLALAASPSLRDGVRALRGARP